MILYLLFTFLFLGVVESQKANRTKEELSKAEGNQTFSVSTEYNSTIEAGNVTSRLYNNIKSHIDDELQNNQTSFPKEDDESFQDQETNYSGIRCNEYMQVEFSRSICGTHFSKKMMEVSTENWCDLENIIKPYHELTLCLEQLSVLAGCYYPNSNIQDFFLVIHSHYFQNCTEELLLLEDAPHSLVITLTLISVSLIPILVYVVVWKSKFQE